ncbi:MAG: S8 family serine peptidase [Pseudomonadota bacterium]
MRAAWLARWCLALLCCWLAPARGALPTEEAAAPSLAAERQVLVMLHLPPPHFRPDLAYAGAYGDGTGHAARRRIAQELAQRTGLTLVSDWPMPVLGIDCYVMEARGDVQPARALAQLAQDERVEWAQPLASFRALQGRAADAPAVVRPVQPREGAPDPLFAIQPGATFWHLAELHQRATGHNVRVAVVDSGIEDQHPDLAGQVVMKENFVDASAYSAESHGTAVAGIIAAKAGNGVGVEGVASNARLLALRACWEVAADRSTRCDSFSLAKALNFALMRKAQVINLSLSGPQDVLLQRLLDVALARGVSVVGAVDPAVAGGGFPASHPGVIAVAERAEQAAGLDPVLAPGSDVPSTAPGGRWSLFSGTSFAAAHVAGMAALLTELRPATPLRRDAFVTAVGAPVKGQGGGLDACASVARAAADCVCGCAAVVALKANPSP